MQDLPGISISTSLHPKYGCAVGLLQVDGHEPGDVSNWLFRNYKLHTTGIKWDNINGVRITPNVYTMPKDLDVLVEAIKKYPV